MLNLSVKVDARQVVKMLEQAKKQAAFAASVAVLEVAKLIVPAEKRLIASTFAHPRPFTVNSVSYSPKGGPSRSVLTRRVFIMDRTAPFLAPYEFGGGHFIPNHPELGRVILEPVGIKLDRAGQITHLRTLLARPDVFVGTVHNILGIWQRSKTKRGTRRDGTYGTRGKLQLLDTGRRTTLKLLAKVDPNQDVTTHLPFIEQGIDMAELLMPDAFDRAFAQRIGPLRCVLLHQGQIRHNQRPFLVADIRRIRLASSGRRHPSPLEPRLVKVHNTL